MKKTNKSERYDISVKIKSDIEIGLITSHNNPQDFHTMNHLTPQEQEELALHIATALDDTDKLQWHLRKVRQHPKEVLLAELEYVLEKPRKDIRNSRAAYYNFLLSNYERTGKYHSRA